MTSKRETDAFLAKVRNALERRYHLQPGQGILAAVSGGADSMAMLYTLSRLGYTVEVMHYDHTTRHGASGADARFVEEQAHQLGVPCHVGRAEEDQWQKTPGTSFEAAARAARYEFFLEVARDHPENIIATGHQADDQAETMLMRMMNFGADIGMAGIPPERKIEGRRIIRPLLECTRREIQAWLEQNGIPWREDATNHESDYLRNRVRHLILPFLEQHSLSVRRNLVRLADLLHTDTGFLDKLAGERLDALTWPLPPAMPPNLLLVLDRVGYADLPTALRRHLLRVLSFRYALDMTYERILATERMLVAGNTGTRCDLGKGCFLEVGRSGAFVVGPIIGPGDPPPSVPLAVPGSTRALGYVFETRLLPGDSLPLETIPAYCGSLRQVFDWDALAFPLAVRTRAPGESMRPFGGKRETPLPQLFKRWGIPKVLRDHLPLVADRHGILWTVGYKRSHQAPVLSCTKTALVIEVYPADGRGSPAQE